MTAQELIDELEQVAATSNLTLDQLKVKIVESVDIGTELVVTTPRGRELTWITSL